MTNILTRLIVVLVLIIAPQISVAKRVGPPLVTPVKIDTLEYRAPMEYGPDKYLEEWDIKSNTLVARYKIYEIRFEPLMEKDVQNVFIKTLEVKDKNIVITNEKNQIYIFNTISKKVSKPENAK
jgi:hypothetical protein